MAEWEALTAGKRRGMLYQIGTAKTAPTRAKRIDAMIQGLR
nr:YdeI/OmpD-associated family protein [Rhodobacter kunshanensis]